MRPVECGPDFSVALGRSETHDHVVWPENGFESASHHCREIECRQSALTDDHGMHKLHGDMLSIGSRGATAQGKQTSPAQKALRHFLAGHSHGMGMAGEEIFEDLIAFEQPLGDLLCEIDLGYHCVLLTDPGQGIAYKHVDDAGAAIARIHNHGVGRALPDFADDAGFLAAFGLQHGI